MKWIVDVELVDSIVGSQHRNMKELRSGSSGRSELRVLFAFDPEWQAILLVAGVKSGNWENWYRGNVPIADERFIEHLDRLEEMGLQWQRISKT